MIQTSLINISCLIYQSFLFILVSSPDMTEEGYRGLHCCLLHKRHLLHEKLSSVTSTYALVDASSSFSPFEEEKEDAEEEGGEEEGGEEEESQQDYSSSEEEL